MSAAPASESAAHFQDSVYRPALSLPAEGATPVPLVARGAGAERGARAPARAAVEAQADSAGAPSLLHRVHDIIALIDQPELRNLLITQCYHDLSVELVKLLGGRNAHWCTFATWASKTAGRFIRNEEVPSTLRRLILSEEDETENPPRTSGFSMIKPWWGYGLGLMDIPERILLELSLDIAVGNLKVFQELGPLFARMIELYRDCPRPDDARLAALLEGLQPGPSPKGGQGLLRSAMMHYHAALLTDDLDKKAELILLANARVGLHEQVRLQPYIARSIEAPVRCMRAALGAPGRRLPEALRSMVAYKLEKLQALWCSVATKEMMSMGLPDEVLALGADLPPPPGSPLHCAELATIEDRELYELLREYDAHDQTTKGSGAKDWTSLNDRMSYILELFRSRQCCPRLLERPFSREQHAEIVSWRVPKPHHGEL
ncbi:hypothetical protein SOCE26_046370 [Sorangium cellulosum]|uniref:Uncharacterized protein n=2 Tax=Sorangium cellulosum TaxID=56 RepID=A0A2L0EV72_SORCE|nr:hypothetical protein SOCE26_046370 [Sorangium cellulosum]